MLIMVALAVILAKQWKPTQPNKIKFIYVHLSIYLSSIIISGARKSFMNVKDWS